MIDEMVALKSGCKKEDGRAYIVVSLCVEWVVEDGMLMGDFVLRHQSLRVVCDRRLTLISTTATYDILRYKCSIMRIYYIDSPLPEAISLLPNDSPRPSMSSLASSSVMPRTGTTT